MRIEMIDVIENEKSDDYLKGVAHFDIITEKDEVEFNLPFFYTKKGGIYVKYPAVGINGKWLLSRKNKDAEKDRQFSHMIVDKIKDFL